MNQFRLPLAACCLGTILLLRDGTVIPLHLESWQFWLLIVSAFFGLAFGDGFYFRSLVLIGPRRATLMSSFSPVMTALLAWPLLGERLSLLTWGAILLTVCGIVWVILERTETTPPGPHLKSGVIFGFIGALAQGGGLLLAKIAMDGTLGALNTAFIRISSAALMVWIYSVVIGKNGQHLARFSSRESHFFVGDGFHARSGDWSLVGFVCLQVYGSRSGRHAHRFKSRLYHSGGLGAG